MAGSVAVHHDRLMGWKVLGYNFEWPFFYVQKFLHVCQLIVPFIYQGTLFLITMQIKLRMHK